MISYLVYKNIHLIGVFMTLVALGGLMVHSVLGAERGHPFRKMMAATHGIGLFLALLGGFGMLARLAIHWPWPAWIIVKVVVWVIFGALIAVIARKPAASKLLWWVVIGLAGFAAYVAQQKPWQTVGVPPPAIDRSYIADTAAPISAGESAAPASAEALEPATAEVDADPMQD
jgi:hypothetical protein